MIRTTTLLLTAALGLIMSAITAQAANTQLATTQAAKPTSSPISRLPYTIGAPGTYVVTGNLTCFTAGNAITINVTSPGTVILNLNGFTLYANPNIGAGPGDNAVAILNTNAPASIVTVKNGTIGGLDQGFGNGVSVNGSATGYLANVTVDHVNFYAERFTDISFSQVDSSTVSNCTFIGLVPGQSAVQYGIEDNGSRGGNRYINNSFDGGQTNMLQIGNTGPLLLDRCILVPPVN